MLKNLLLLFNTIKYLKFVQIFFRFKRKIHSPNIYESVAPSTRIIISPLKPVIQSPQRMFDSYRFKFLNEEFNVKNKRDWNSLKQEKLWLYNLHYFDDLNAVNSKKRIDLHNVLLKRWINENPIGYGNGWEPYPTSLRIVNWIKWLLLNDVAASQEYLNSLAMQVRFLVKNLEYHLLGNHLFSNAKALIFAGLFFDGVEAKNWHRKGIAIFNKELIEQVLKDGGNFELSPMYHSIFLEDLMDLINIHQVYKINPPGDLMRKAEQMLEWLQVMIHPDGEIAFFNDTTLNHAPTYQELLNYSQRLNTGFKKKELTNLIHLEDSGYIRFNNENLTIIADVGNIGPDYLPGHAHADTLSFEMSLFGERFIVNSGISTYKIGTNRMHQRGTLAHSTISINKKNSSEVWSGFRVGKRARIMNIKKHINNKSTIFSACHNGFSSYRKKLIHFRKWSLSKSSVLITDRIEGVGIHDICSVLPLSPNIEVLRLTNNFADIRILDNKVKIQFDGLGFLKITNSNYYPGFGVSYANKHLTYEYNGILPYKVKVKITW